MENQDHSLALNAQKRKRGRPAGKNRQPLDKEERKARNAQYERERRVGIATATAELADAAGVDQSVSMSVLLNTALHILSKASKVPSPSAETMRKRNLSMSREIQDLERFLEKKEKRTKQTQGLENVIHNESSSSKGEPNPDDFDVLFNVNLDLSSDFDLDIDPCDLLKTCFD
ncbi:uncharacterized protein [Battus philenor]|uniref:uncharacterized protein n=1 Tax=Battus philenor TaxID=42288 RepID=UPI0035CFFA5E